MSDQPLASYNEMATILGNLGFLVRETRRQRRLSQRAASDQIGCANSTVSRLEAGFDVSLMNAVMILEWLHRGSVPSGTEEPQ